MFVKKRQAETFQYFKTKEFSGKNIVLNLHKNKDLLLEFFLSYTAHHSCIVIEFNKYVFV